MDSSILHVQQDFILDVDFAPSKLLHVLDVLTVLTVPFQNRSIDVTTTLGEYHYSLTITELKELFLEKEDVINSITISEQVGPGKVPTSLVLYIRSYENYLKTSFTISSSSQEQNQIIEELLIDDLEKLKEEYAKSTSFSLSDTFLFDQRISKKALSKFILKIDERVFPDYEIEVDVLLGSDELILIGDEQINLLTSHQLEKKRKIVCVHKQCDTGSRFDLFLFFEDDRNGFAYLEMASGSKKEISSIKQFVTRELQLNKRQLKSMRSKQSNRPYLQQQFEVNSAFEADQIIDSLGKISKRFLKEVEMELRFISPSHKAYCYSESDCKVLRQAFRSNRRGVLVASKRFKDLYEVKICINFRSLTKSVAYCYIALPTFQENVEAFNLIKSSLQPVQRDKPVKSSDAIVQDAFYFDPTISAGQMIWFIKMIDNEFLREEITNIRLTTLNGDKHYFYNEEYLEIIDLFEQKIHDTVYINKQSSDGQSITINLQFHGQPGIPNCFYSINLFKKDGAGELKSKIIQILQNYQEEGPHNSNEPPKEEPTTELKAALYIPDSKIRKKWGGLLAAFGFKLNNLLDEYSGDELLEKLGASELILIDVNKFNQRSSFIVGMARGTGRRTILLAEKGKRVPNLIKGLPVLHFDYDTPDFESIKADFSHLMVI